MKKSILNLSGAYELSKKEQKNINGGKLDPNRGNSICICSNPTYLVHQTPSADNGYVGNYTTTDGTIDGAVLIGFSVIFPAPACCNH
jgi:hypothetical protein